MSRFKLKKNDRVIIGNLLKYALNKQSVMEFDEYIIDSFNAFRQSKQEIILDLYELSDGNDEMRNLLMHPMKNEQKKLRYDDDFTNTFRADLLSLYPNTKSLIIRSNYRYTMSMIALLQLIVDSNLNKVVVKGQKNYFNWTEKLWQKDEARLTMQYAQNGFGISYKKETFTITRQ